MAPGNGCVRVRPGLHEFLPSAEQVSGLHAACGRTASVLEPMAGQE